MAGLLTGDKTVSYEACAAPFFFFVAFITAGSFPSAAMACARRAAACKAPPCAPAAPTGACARARRLPAPRLPGRLRPRRGFSGPPSRGRRGQALLLRRCSPAGSLVLRQLRQ
ncbi:hypothetical protein R6Z07M_014465 [Ovis aries]